MQYLYHGSCRKLCVGDKLVCHKQYNHHSNGLVSGVFATSSLDKAKYFGIVNCIAANIPGSRRVKRNKQIFIEDIAPEIKTKFYVYCVAPDGFELDAADEYICPNDVKVLEVMEFDLAKTLDTESWEIYFTPHTDIQASTQERIQQMKEFIDNKDIKRINITNQN